MPPLARGAAWLSLLREGMTTMKSTIYATVSALALLAAAPAIAGTNNSTVTQSGTNGTATVTQTGSNSGSTVSQSGDVDVATVNQSGATGSDSTVDQTGSGNHA